MNEKIMKFSSDKVYDGMLLAHESVAQHSIGEEESVLLYIDTFGAKMGENICEKGSKYNIGEADLVYVVVKELFQKGVKYEDIGIITPYNAQVDLIRKVLEKHELSRQSIEVSTVDGF